jgi:hypothetical protein
LDLGGCVRDEMVNFELVTSDGGPSQLKYLMGTEKTKTFTVCGVFLGVCFAIDRSLNE